ncbi:hypothetical protein H4582DRAFT_1959517 [Lactarius indigo]|nr:hypothetical protein H4582DRAFT_1959517 [Lactarius indigo]
MLPRAKKSSSMSLDRKFLQKWWNSRNSLKVAGWTDLEDGLKKLDELTDEEVMAAVQVPKVTHRIDSKVTGVGDGMGAVQARRTPRARFRRLPLHLRPHRHCHRGRHQEFHPRRRRHRRSAPSTTQTVAVTTSAVPPTMTQGHKDPNPRPWPAILLTSPYPLSFFCCIGWSCLEGAPTS